MISYLREYDGLDIRYAEVVWIGQGNAISVPIAGLVAGYINTNLKVNMRVIVLLGSLIFTGSYGLAYFALKESFILVIGYCDYIK